MSKYLSWWKCINVNKVNLQGPKEGLWTSMWIPDTKKAVSLRQYPNLFIAFNWELWKKSKLSILRSMFDFL